MKLIYDNVLQLKVKIILQLDQNIEHPTISPTYNLNHKRLHKQYKNNHSPQNTHKIYTKNVGRMLRWGQY
jgi:hypothetical protein